MSNDYYELQYDGTANRIHCSVKGFWRSPGVVPGYLDDWKKLLARVKPGFTVLANATGMTVLPPLEVRALHEQVEELCLEKGLSKIGEVVSAAVIEPSTSKIYRQHELVAVKKQFRDITRAITWLNSTGE